MRPFVFAVIVLSTVMVLSGMAEPQNAELSAPPDVAISNAQSQSRAQSVPLTPRFTTTRSAINLLHCFNARSERFQ